MAAHNIVVYSVYTQNLDYSVNWSELLPALLHCSTCVFTVHVSAGHQGVQKMDVMQHACDMKLRLGTIGVKGLLKLSTYTLPK